MLDMAKLLKGSANVFMAGVLARRVMQDLRTEVRNDVARSPYGAAGAATVLGVVAGMFLARRHRRQSAGKEGGS
jgi:hypothetical protein